MSSIMIDNDAQKHRNNQTEPWHHHSLLYAGRSDRSVCPPAPPTSLQLPSACSKGLPPSTNRHLPGVAPRSSEVFLPKVP
jgi:hypothetical protein